MDSTLPELPAERPAALDLRVIAIGAAGGRVLQGLCNGLTGVARTIFLDNNLDALGASLASEKLYIESKRMEGLGTGADPEMGRRAAEEHLESIRGVCEGADLVVLLAGMGGGLGTGACPVVARLAKEAGALVVACAVLPFEFEGTRRMDQAREGLQQLRIFSDCVLTQPNQKVFQLIPETAPLMDAFAGVNGRIGDALAGLIHLLTPSGLIDIPFKDLAGIVRRSGDDGILASVASAGPDRVENLLNKLAEHPLLDGGQAVRKADRVVLHLTGGEDLTMIEVKALMEPLRQRADTAHFLFGATAVSGLENKLRLTLMVVRGGRAADRSVQVGEVVVSEAGEPDLQLDTQFLQREPEPLRSGRRFSPVPVEPSKGSNIRPGKSAKLQQSVLPLDIGFKGRFDGCEPTVHHGEDLDIPTYIRRGVPLN